MLSMDTEATRASLRSAESDMLSSLRQALGHGAALALYLAKSTTSFKDGPNASLRKSMTRGQRSEWHLFVQASSKHALFVEEDTKAHVIRAKLARGAKGPVGPGQSRGGRSGLLTFQIAGRWISKPFVNHPGTRGKHFMQAARDQAEGALVGFIEAGLSRTLG